MSQENLGNKLCVIAICSGLIASESVSAMESVFEEEAPRVMATIRLAEAAESGKGQTRNLARASRLYCEAAREGSSEAAYRLGTLYVGWDESLASSLFRAAAEQGHEKALESLSKRGASKDVEVDCLKLPERSWVWAQSFAKIDIDAYARSISDSRAAVIVLIRRLAPEYSVDTKLALSIAAVESGFNSSAVSPKSAAGVMQLMPGTAARFGVRNVMDPEQNVRGGLAYLRWLREYFKGDLVKTVAGYNAGHAAVDRYGGIPPYDETRNYVRRVLEMVPPKK